MSVLSFLKVSVFFVMFGFLAVPAFAELSINPYPLSGAVRAPSQPVAVQEPVETVDFEAYQDPVSVLEPAFVPAHPPVDVVADVQSSREWSTFRGADLREVLETWSRARNIEVIWNLSGHYRVKETVSIRDSYENAVAALLAQFDGLYVRPVASLHVSPNGQGRTLVIFKYEGC